ncbi:MAG: nucleotide exchange factor GrpE [Alphaproteobacteria bacterium]|nr:nucleotide exchange factor GrpE [Alphaproteobacteria bacterium]
MPSSNDAETPATPPDAPRADDAAPADAAAAEIAELKDKLLRALAEGENMRRRFQKERDDTSKYAIANFARAMLAVADNLRRALDAAGPELAAAGDGAKTLVEGLALTEREMLTNLERFGIVRIDPVGQRFSHDRHEAMFEVPTADVAPGTVVQVLEVGYMIHDRLLRPARVGVAKAPPGSAEPSAKLDTTV